MTDITTSWSDDFSTPDAFNSGRYVAPPGAVLLGGAYSLGSDGLTVQNGGVANLIDTQSQVPAGVTSIIIRGGPGYGSIDGGTTNTSSGYESFGWLFGLIRCTAAGAVSQFGADATMVEAIPAGGVTSGASSDDSGNTTGFVATILPEGNQSTLVLSGSGFAPVTNDMTSHVADWIGFYLGVSLSTQGAGTLSRLAAWSWEITTSNGGGGGGSTTVPIVAGSIAAATAAMGQYPIAGG
jgi:hypothetical protein